MALFDSTKPLAGDSQWALLAKIAQFFGGSTVQPVQGTNAIASAGTPERLVATSTLASSVEIYGRKSPTVANTGNLYVGFSSTGGQNYRVVAPGTGFTISAAGGSKIDLMNIYVDAATSADVAVYTYIP